MGTRSLSAVLVLVALAACSDPEDGTPDAGEAPTDGAVADGGENALELQVLDPDAPGKYPLAIAVAGERVGVAYFVDTGSSPARQLRYVEAGASPQAVADVDNVQGVSLAFGDDGEPLIAYLGGGSDESLYWKQSDLALARRASGTWTSETLARTSGDVTTGNPVSDTGLVVGLSPALAVRPDGEIFVAHRDVHGGQFPTDYKGSDVELVEGRPGAWRQSVAIMGGDLGVGHGARMGVALSDGVPALVWSAQPGSASDTPRDVWFARPDTSGTWTATLLAATGDTRSGPVLAWRAGGFGIAFEDASKGVLSYLESADGKAWKPAEPVFGSGTGGWFPSLAFAADGEPAIAFYICSEASAAITCKDSEDALVIKKRRAGVWPVRETTIDPAGAWWPRLAYAGGKMVVAYKDSQAGLLKLAIER